MEIGITGCCIIEKQENVMNRIAVAKELIGVAKEISSAEREFIPLGANVSAMIYPDGMVSFWKGGKALVVISGTGAKKLAQMILNPK